MFLYLQLHYIQIFLAHLAELAAYLTELAAHLAELATHKGASAPLWRIADLCSFLKRGNNFHT